MSGKQIAVNPLYWIGGDYFTLTYQLHLVSEISPHYNWCLVPEKFRIKDYEAMGARPIYCQEAANPTIYKPYDVPVEFDVTFVGQAYGDRPLYIGHLLDQGIDARVWGYGWQNYSLDGRGIVDANQLKRALRIGRKLLTPAGWQAAAQRLRRSSETQNAACDSSSASVSKVGLPAAALGGTLSDIEMVKLYSRSKINLGFSSCGDTHKTGERILQVRLRDFEVPMSGGFYMVEYMAELEEFFDIGKEVVCYEGPEDLAEKITYFLQHDNEREKIRKAGYERCLRDHTWHKRFEMVFKEIGLV